MKFNRRRTDRAPDRGLLALGLVILISAALAVACFRWGILVALSALHR
jgi:hypothetical protein